MALYTLGTPVFLTATIYDNSTPPVLVNVTGTVHCSVYLPDSTTATPSVGNASTGVYTAIYHPAVTGMFDAVIYKADGGDDDFRKDLSFTVRARPPGAFANPDDVAARWRPLTAAELIIASALCDDASALIRAEFPGIDGQVSSGAVDPSLVLMVVAGMVKRALIAPLDGVSQQSEGAGPYSQSQTFANPMRNVFLTAADRVLILGYQPAASSHRYGNTTRQCGDGGYFATVYGAWP